MLVLYTQDCPKCKVLEKKLNEKLIPYTKCTDMSELEKNNIVSIPVLKLEDGTMLLFNEAINWVNNK